MGDLDPTFGQSAAELKRQIELERLGKPFLVLRQQGGDQRIVPLVGKRRLAICREGEVDVALPGDEQASCLHAELELIGSEWVIVDDGLSTNGTFVNDERVTSRRRVADRDLIGIGETALSPSEFRP